MKLAELAAASGDNDEARKYIKEYFAACRDLTQRRRRGHRHHTYDAFGNLIASTGTTVNAYRYTGEQYDPHVGFYYLRARYYNQGVGRFTTSDPFGGMTFDPMSLHKYAYAGNSPPNNIDPSGESYTSLVELMAVLVIIAILSSILFAHVSHYISRNVTAVKWEGLLGVATWNLPNIKKYVGGWLRVAGGFFVVALESECHFGSKAEGVYLVVMAGITISFPWIKNLKMGKGKVSFLSFYTITLDTPGLLDADPWLLVGPAPFYSITTVVGVGASVAKLTWDSEEEYGALVPLSGW